MSCKTFANWPLANADDDLPGNIMFGEDPLSDKAPIINDDFHNDSDRPKLPLYNNTTDNKNDFTGYSSRSSRSDLLVPSLLQKDYPDMKSGRNADYSKSNYSSKDIGDIVSSSAKGFGSLFTSIADNSVKLRGATPISSQEIIKKNVTQSDNSVTKYAPYAIAGIIAVALLTR